MDKDEFLMLKFKSELEKEYILNEIKKDNKDWI
jgi:hypothetical protein